MALKSSDSFFPIVLVLVLYGFVFVTCFPFFRFPFSFLVAGGIVAMIAAWTPLSPNYSKEVTADVALLTGAFGTHFDIESCL